VELDSVPFFKHGRDDARMFEGERGDHKEGGVDARPSESIEYL